MSQIVREWMSSPVIFIDADSTVAQALTLMRRRNIHSLMVALSGNDFGIVTTTDIRDKIAGAERDPKTTLVSEIMTAPVICAQSRDVPEGLLPKDEREGSAPPARL